MFFFSFQPTPQELATLSNSFPDQSKLAMTGVVVSGEKFFYLSGTDRVSKILFLLYYFNLIIKGLTKWLCKIYCFLFHFDKK